MDMILYTTTTSSSSVGNLKPLGVTTSFQWTIPNFFVNFKNIGNVIIHSPIYFNQWTLALKLLEIENMKNYISIYLVNISEEKVTGRVEFAIINGIGNKVQVSNSDIATLQSFGNVWGIDDFVQSSFVMDLANDVLVNGALTVQCDIYLHHSVASVKLKSYTVEALLELTDSYEKLFESENLSDVTFCVDDKQLRAHKNILVARSPVFAAMFTNEMKESRENTVDLEDVNYEVLKELMRFIYSGNVKDIHTHAKGLLVAADKYQIKGLKTLCEKVLAEGLTVENALEYLGLADMHNSSGLKTKAIDFTVLNMKDIVTKPQYKSFGKSNPALICELLYKMATKEA